MVLVLFLILRSAVLVLRASGLGLGLAHWSCLHVIEVNSDAVSNRYRLRCVALHALLNKRGRKWHFQASRASQPLECLSVSMKSN